MSDVSERKARAHRIADKLLYTAEQRIQRAFMKVTAGRAFTPEQRQWLERIRVHLVENLSIKAI